MVQNALKWSKMVQNDDVQKLPCMGCSALRLHTAAPSLDAAGRGWRRWPAPGSALALLLSGRVGDADLKVVNRGTTSESKAPPPTKHDG